MPEVGVPELLIILVIVVLLFGPGKAADLGSSLGKSISEFRKATREDAAAPSQIAPRVESSGASSVALPSTRFCSECGAQNDHTAKFCTGCGAPTPRMA